MANKKVRRGRDVRAAAAAELRAMRAHRRLTQKQAAALLAKERTFVSLLETQQQQVRIQDLVDMCAAYEFDPVEAFKRIVGNAE